MANIRVRFAPSPTGALHIGGARTALFNWLWAKHSNGTFILRLEDTDIRRSTADSAQGIIDGLRWLGITWDEGPDIGGIYGPYRQSERLSVYQTYLDQLLQSDRAYYCFCPPNEQTSSLTPKYGQPENSSNADKCRSLSPQQVKSNLAAGMKPVIKFKVDTAGITTVNDIVRGEVNFANSLIDDFIIAKSDGWPTYNFAVVVDDFTMKISHVIRAEEHLPNTPKQVQLYHALGFNIPEFVHLSMILAPDRSKLSKRHGATSVQEFRDKGFLASALVNYLALLGWSTGRDIDIWPLESMIAAFDLKQMSKTAAVYDIDKLTWMNGQYISRLNPGTFQEMLQTNPQNPSWLKDINYFGKTAALLQSRLKTLNDFWSQAEYFFTPPAVYEEKGKQKYFDTPFAADYIKSMAGVFSDTDEFTAQALEPVLRLLADNLEVKAAQLIHPLRLALTGRTNSPGIFEVMELLGSQNCLQRLEKALAEIQKN